MTSSSRACAQQCANAKTAVVTAAAAVALHLHMLSAKRGETELTVIQRHKQRKPRDVALFYVLAIAVVVRDAQRSHHGRHAHTYKYIYVYQFMVIAFSSSLIAGIASAATSLYCCYALIMGIFEIRNADACGLCT